MFVGRGGDTQWNGGKCRWGSILPEGAAMVLRVHAAGLFWVSCGAARQLMRGHCYQAIRRLGFIERF